MKQHLKLTLLLAVSLLTVTQAAAQYYINRKHDSGNDTIKVYKTWQSIYFNGPDTIAVNPNVEINSPFYFKFKPTEKNNKPLKQLIEKQAVAVSIGDSVWFVNSKWVRDSLSGQYNKLFEGYMPLLFNEKIAFIQYIQTSISYLPVELKNLEGVYAGVGRESIFETSYYGLVAVPHFVIDLENKAVHLVDRDYLAQLLDFYPDLKRRFLMMRDQEEFYMINPFFWDFVDRISSDPTYPTLPIKP